MWAMKSRMSMTALARRSSGSGLIEQEGNGGGHRRALGGCTRYYTNPSRYASPRSRSLMGRPSGHNASPWSRKPEGRTKREGRVLCGYPPTAGTDTWADPGNLGATRSGEYREGPGGGRAQVFSGRDPLSRFVLPSGQSSHRNALSPPQGVSPGERAGSRSCIAHASRSQRHPAHAGQAERQAGYQTAQDQGLVVGRAVGPARGMPKGMGEVRPC